MGFGILFKFDPQSAANHIGERLPAPFEAANQHTDEISEKELDVAEKKKVEKRGFGIREVWPRSHRTNPGTKSGRVRRAFYSKISFLLRYHRPFS